MTQKTKFSTDTSVTGSKLLRWSGLSAMAAGAIFAGIQPFHPPDTLTSVTTNAWTIIISLKLAMCFFMLVGIAGLYARQVASAGKLGLIGFLLFSVSWWLLAGFIFAELFILPVLATTTPQYVESFLGIINGSPGDMNIGALPAIYGIVGVSYLLGGLIFGIATFRARVLPRWPAGLLAVTALVTPAAGLLPLEFERFAAVPMGIALILLGYALFNERK